MQFDPKQIAFGRHESFALRFSWLTKGFQQFERDNKIFSIDDAVVRLGVGKNMVNSEYRARQIYFLRTWWLGSLP